MTDRHIDLKELSNETISRLSEFVHIPLVTQDVPFQPSDPALNLYLASNRLTRAPGAIFNLEFLTVLSLRNNRITELPPSIANLRNLTDLNLSLNRLRYLPVELLDLLLTPGKVDNLSIHPNPFYQPENMTLKLPDPQALWDPWCLTGHVHVFYEMRGVQVGPNTYDFKAWCDKKDFDSEDTLCRRFLQRWQMGAIARSPVQYSDSRGVALSKFRLPPTGEPAGPFEEQPANMVIPTEDLRSAPAPCPSDARGPSGEASPAPSRVPSLFELALRACARSGEPLSELPSYLPPGCPAQLPAALGRLAAQAEDIATPAGDVPCGVCGRRVVAPATAWIEWWDVATNDLHAGSEDFARATPLSKDDGERFVPFLRRGCSWGCVPAPMEPGQMRPGPLKWSMIRLEE